jgi:undecaprenyl-diphosphatase
MVLVGIVAGAGLFAGLAFGVARGMTDEFDRHIVLAMRQPDNPDDPLGPRWLEEAARDLTSLGGYVVLILVTAIVASYLGLVRKHHAAQLLLVAAVGGVIVMHLLKSAVNRPRPDFVSHLAYDNSASFPSGHAMLSAVIYLTLGAMLTRLVECRRVKLFVMSVAALLSFSIGVSRVYLGVHYPTDVLAGWSAGLVWAGLCWMLTRYLQRQGAVERDTAGLDVAE